MQEDTYIDMTPTAEQSVRMQAYALAMRLESSPYDFGDYWNYTEDESFIINYTWEQYMAFADVLEEVGIKLNDFPKSAIKKFIKAAIAKMKRNNEVKEEQSWMD